MMIEIRAEQFERLRSAFAVLCGELAVDDAGDICSRPSLPGFLQLVPISERGENFFRVFFPGFFPAYNPKSAGDLLAALGAPKPYANCLDFKPRYAFVPNISDFMQR